MRRFRRPGRVVRRRLFRRLARRATWAAPLPGVRRAHRLMAGGEYSHAAAEYLALAEQAEAQSAPQAARLYAAAGMAAVEAGDTDVGVDHLLHGLALLEQQAAPGRLAQVTNRLITELRAKGHEPAAERIEAFVRERGLDRQTTAGPQEPRGSLPAQCPQCGGSVHPAEVAWIDSRPAECDYCGTILRTES